MELTDKVYSKILSFGKQGEALSETGNFTEAIVKYKNALQLVPNPKYEWEASTWIYSALGDTYYLNNQFSDALTFLFETLKCPNGLKNPFIFLRIGECFYELDNNDKAKEYLLQAYMLEGENIFSDEDPKYFEIIKKIV